MSVIDHCMLKIAHLYLFVSYLTVAHPTASDDEVINI